MKVGRAPGLVGRVSVCSFKWRSVAMGVCTVLLPRWGARECSSGTGFGGLSDALAAAESVFKAPGCHCDGCYVGRVDSGVLRSVCSWKHGRDLLHIDLRRSNNLRLCKRVRVCASR